MALLVLVAIGVRVGELEPANVADLDENRKQLLVRAPVAKLRAEAGCASQVP